MKIMSCDPGNTGALAVFEDGDLTEIHDMPTMAKLVGKGITVDAVSLSQIITDDIDHFYVEQVSAMPKQGVTSTFNFGYSTGIIHGIVAARMIPMSLVRPVDWKRYCGLVKKDKDAARSFALQKYPHFVSSLGRKKDIGRADAICIGHYVVS